MAPDALTADRAAQRRRGRARRRPRRAIAAGPSPASSSCRTAATRAGQESARPRTGPPIYAIGVGSPVGGQGPRDPGRDRRRDHPGRLARGPGGVGGEPRARQRADRAAAARERPAHRRPARDAGGRRRRPCAKSFRSRPARAHRRSTPSRRPLAAGELVPENNARSVLVQPPARARRVLLVEGAPGFEHSFLKRAWASDPGLEIDSVVRKGKNEQGADTFYIQAAQSRSDSLADRLPVDARGALSLRRAGARQRRGASVHARAARGDARFVGERGRRPARARRAVVPAPGARRDAARGCAAARAQRDGGRRRSSGARRRERPRRESRVSHRRRARRIPIMQLAAGAGRDAEAMGSRAGAGGDRAARRAATRARACWR